MNRGQYRQAISDYAQRFIGLPYIWGGDDPIKGFDCSGFVIECLKSVGFLPRKGDWTAEGLKELFKKHKVTLPGAGALVFYAASEGEEKAVHVELCLNDVQAIGASGGGRKTTTSNEAAAQNAYIKVRPIESRKHIICFLDPFLTIR